MYAVYLALFVGFAVKVPMFPFHTWLPDAHVEAPTAVSDPGRRPAQNGHLRHPADFVFRVAHHCDGSFLVAAIFANRGSCTARSSHMAQTDLKKMVAYSSVNHMGYVLLGLAAMNEIGFQGAVMQMFAHGLITGCLFLLVGVIYDRAHTRDINAFGGLGGKRLLLRVHDHRLAMLRSACRRSQGSRGILCFLGRSKIPSSG